MNSKLSNRGVEGFIIQKYIMPRKKKPQIIRVDISKNNFLQVYQIKLKKTEYFLAF